MGILDALVSLFVKKTSSDDIAQKTNCETKPNSSFTETHQTPAPTPSMSYSTTIEPQAKQEEIDSQQQPSSVEFPNPIAPALCDEDILLCPHCKTKISDPPKKKRKCASCGQFMCVRKLPSGRIGLFTEEQAKSLCSRTLPSGERVLVTQQVAADIDKQWEQEYEKRRAEWWLKELKFSVQDYQKLCEQITSQGKSLRWRDVIWSMCNSRVQSLIASKSYWEMKLLYYDMARFCNEEKKDCSHLLREAARAELLNYQQSGVTVVEVIAGDCKTCKRLDGKKYKIAVALKSMPLPPANCTCKMKEDDDHVFCKSMWAGAEC